MGMSWESHLAGFLFFSLVLGSPCCFPAVLGALEVTVHIVEPGIFKQTALYDTWEKGHRDNWDNAPAAVRADYGEKWLERGIKGLGGSLKFSNSDPSLVPKAMFDALSSDAPTSVPRTPSPPGGATRPRPLSPSRSRRAPPLTHTHTDPRRPMWCRREGRGGAERRQEPE